MGTHRPMAKSRRNAERMAASVAADIEIARCGLASTIEEVARRANLSPSTVVRVLAGHPGVHIDTLTAVGAAVGLRISIKAYPGETPSLRDTGQLRVAEYLLAQAHASLTSTLELPVGDAYGRACDLVFFAPTEIEHLEIERRLPDFQASYRAARIKRDALQSQHSRPVRLVLVIEDTRRNRAMVHPHLDLMRTVLPANSSEVLRALRGGTPLRRDGLLWVRPWRRHAGPPALQTYGSGLPTDLRQV